MLPKMSQVYLFENRVAPGGVIFFVNWHHRRKNGSTPNPPTHSHIGPGSVAGSATYTQTCRCRQNRLKRAVARLSRPTVRVSELQTMRSSLKGMLGICDRSCALAISEESSPSTSAGSKGHGHLNDLKAAMLLMMHLHSAPPRASEGHPEGGAGEAT